MPILLPTLDNNWFATALGEYPFGGGGSPKGRIIFGSTPDARAFSIVASFVSDVINSSLIPVTACILRFERGLIIVPVSPPPQLSRLNGFKNDSPSGDNLAAPPDFAYPPNILDNLVIHSAPDAIAPSIIASADTDFNVCSWYPCKYSTPSSRYFNPAEPRNILKEAGITFAPRLNTAIVSSPANLAPCLAFLGTASSFKGLGTTERSYPGLLGSIPSFSCPLGVSTKFTSSSI